MSNLDECYITEGGKTITIREYLNREHQKELSQQMRTDGHHKEAKKFLKSLPHRGAKNGLGPVFSRHRRKMFTKDGVVSTRNLTPDEIAQEEVRMSKAMAQGVIRQIITASDWKTGPDISRKVTDDPRRASSVVSLVFQFFHEKEPGVVVRSKVGTGWAYKSKFDIKDGSQEEWVKFYSEEYNNWYNERIRAKKEGREPKPIPKTEPRVEVQAKPEFEIEEVTQSDLNVNVHVSGAIKILFGITKE